MLEYFNDFSEISLLRSNRLLVYDRYLESTPAQNFISTFPFRYPVEAGESLKEITHFSTHIKNLLLGISPKMDRPLTLVGLGGGTVCDFAGFVASIFQRGIGLELIPSTWLSALDSAHGGKNGLNVSGVKNQIGTFYNPQRILLVQTLLKSQPLQRWSEAYPEVIKTALLDGSEWIRHLKTHSETDSWAILPQVIKAKMKIVERDPLERDGHRRILNLGHTLGHILESKLQLPHGLAVGQGLRFAVEWSRRLGLLERSSNSVIQQLLSYLPTPETAPLSGSEAMNTLTHDKKRTELNSVAFVFLKRIGTPVVIEKKPDEILFELKHQGWVY